VVISSVVISLLWQRIYKDLVPAIYELLSLPLPKNGFLANKDTKMMAVFLPSLWQFVGYHMLLMYGALKSISKDILEAAYVDGASGPRMALSIQIPLIKPMLKVCLSFSLIGSFKLFDMVKILTDGNRGTEVPATTMYREIFTVHHYGVGSAMAMFIVAECLIFTLLLNLIFKDQNQLG
jgi:raffinose/stachyose/melibiose transport system permease protein